MRPQIPVALTIAGSDSGGGAGVQADLKTFAALGTHGCSAITALTAQNPAGIAHISRASPVSVRAQIDAVEKAFPIGAIKTGMLYDRGIVQAVVAWRRTRRQPPLIVDPVMVATSGRLLLSAAALDLVRRELLPLATVVTPNIPEANILVGWAIETEDGMQAAARRIFESYGCAVVIKGGHLPHAQRAADVLFDGKELYVLRGPWVRGPRPHGTGCTFSAAVTALLARGLGLEPAVVGAKRHAAGAIRGRQRIGAHWILGFTGGAP